MQIGWFRAFERVLRIDVEAYTNINTFKIKVVRICGSYWWGTTAWNFKTSLAIRDYYPEQTHKRGIEQYRFKVVLRTDVGACENKNTFGIKVVRILRIIDEVPGHETYYNVTSDGRLTDKDNIGNPYPTPLITFV